MTSRHEEHMAAVRRVQRQGHHGRLMRAIAELESLQRVGIQLTHDERGQLRYMRRCRTELEAEMRAAGQDV